jgi:hypothetical protein
MRRALRTLVIAAALLALIAPAAQAKPLEVPSGPLHPTTAQSGANRSASSGTFDWADAAIGAAVTAVLIGAGVTGARLNRRRTVHA